MFLCNMGSKSLLIVLILCHAAFAEDDYYWRDYEPASIFPFTNDSIPSDAFVAGQDANKKNIYIGHTKIDGLAGLRVLTISPGKYVWASFGGSTWTETQVLCTKSSSKLRWKPSYSRPICSTSNLVPGGLNKNNQTTYIGRINRQGNDIMGVVPHPNNDGPNEDCGMDLLYRFDKGKHKAETYEVLVFEST